MAKLWFRARRYGWGWTPVSVEGWLVTAALVLLVVAGIVVFNHAMRGGANPVLALIVFALWVAALAGGQIAIGFARGEAPRWRWGKR